MTSRSSLADTPDDRHPNKVNAALQAILTSAASRVLVDR
jgi:hypothetical protein